jgi:hypothetical protein
MHKIMLIAFLVLTACVSSTAIRPLRPHEIAIGPYYERPTQSFVGSLMYEGGCLMFGGENGGPRLLPIWPAGSKFEETLVTFHRPGKDDQRVTIGEEIRLDGVPSDWSKIGSSQFQSFQRQCDAEPFFVSGLAPAN